MVDDIVSRSRSSWRTGFLAASVVISVAILYSLPGASSVEIVVDDDPGWWAQFNTIQDALNASSDGDTIRVYAGNYGEPITVITQVGIVGNGTGSTHINGSGSQYLVTIISDSVTIESIQITSEGNSTGISSIGSTTRIIDCVVANMSDPGIFLQGDGFEIEATSVMNVTGNASIFTGNDGYIGNSTFQGQVSVRMQGSRNTMFSISTLEGITFERADDNVIDSSDVSGPISIAYSNRTAIMDTTVRDNDHGISLIWSEESLISRCQIIRSNKTGILLLYSMLNRIEECNIRDGNGTGLSLFLYSDHNTVVNNSIQENNGTGIHIDYSMSNLIHRNHFIDNGVDHPQAYDDGWANNWSLSGVGPLAPESWWRGSGPACEER